MVLLEAIGIIFLNIIAKGDVDFEKGMQICWDSGIDGIFMDKGMEQEGI